MKTILYILLCGLLLSGCGGREKQTETETAGDTTSETISETEVQPQSTQAESQAESITYLSLGDSIARGYGLKDIGNTRYSALIREYYAEDGIICMEQNYGVDGQTSTELITYAETLPLTDADVITVSIGANNILGPAFDYLYAYHDYDSNPDTVYTDASIAEKYQTFLSLADEGIVTLEYDIPKIIGAIREQNTDCEIIFLTQYNPYAAVDFTMYINGFPIDFAALSASYVTRISNVISAGAETNGYSVADVRGAFDGKEEKLVVAGAADGTDMGKMDPHPNEKGHRVIAETVYSVMKGE